jgi:signal transduction histidine kinase
MKLQSYEFEAFSKSFILFFLSIELFLITVLYFDYEKQIDLLYHSIHSEMKLCNMELNCEDRFQLSFVEKNETTKKLYISENELFSLFEVGSNNYLLKISYKIKLFRKDIQKIINAELIKALPFTFINILISALFSFFSLKPLRDALKLNDTLIKDIIHDFNTPITSIQINVEILKMKFGEQKNMKRVEFAIQRILSLQKNLKYYLYNIPEELEQFDFANTLNDRIEFFKNIYPKSQFVADIPKSYQVETNKESIIRIIDNILDNSGKYGGGYIQISLKNHILKFEDRGDGIENVDKIFKRFYKENERGLGLGMNIVKRLTDNLKINIKIKSAIFGTTIELNLKNLQ